MGDEMNFQKLFQTKVGLTATEKKTLEALDNSTEPLKAWRDKVVQAFPATGEERRAKLQELAVAFANKPDQEGLEELKKTATLGQNPTTSREDQALILAELEKRIAERMTPQAEVIRAVVKRSAGALERQMCEMMIREKKDCDELALPWQASGVVMALQAKVLALRNRGAKETFGHWKEELADLI